MITSRPTSVMHSLPQPMAVSMNREQLNQFSGNHAAPVAPGSYSIPVRVDSSNASSKDPTLANYETPSFIHKKERQIDNNNSYDIGSLYSNPASPLAINQLPGTNSNTNLETNIQTDVATFRGELAGKEPHTDCEKAKIRKNIFDSFSLCR